MGYRAPHSIFALPPNPLGIPDINTNVIENKGVLSQIKSTVEHKMLHVSICYPSSLW